MNIDFDKLIEDLKKKMRNKKLNFIKKEIKYYENRSKRNKRRIIEGY